MNFDEIKRVFPKCPLKSIYQLWPEADDVSHLLDGYGIRGKGDLISLMGTCHMYDCIFTFDEYPVVMATVTHSLKLDGLLIAKNVVNDSPNLICIYDQDFKVYKKIK